MARFDPFHYFRRPAPLAGSDNALLAAYTRTQSPAKTCYIANGRLVQRNLSPLEGAHIQLGNGAVQNAIVATSLGINSTPGYTPLQRRRSIL